MVGVKFQYLLNLLKWRHYFCSSLICWWCVSWWPLRLPSPGKWDAQHAFWPLYRLLYRHRMDGIQHYSSTVENWISCVKIVSNHPIRVLNCHPLSPQTVTFTTTPQQRYMPPFPTTNCHSHHFTTAALHANLTHHRLPLSPLHHCSVTCHPHSPHTTTLTTTPLQRYMQPSLTIDCHSHHYTTDRKSVV